MALIVKEYFERLEKLKNSVHNEVDCTYHVFIDSRGVKHLQLDTYGSKYRTNHGKVSQ